MTLEHVQGGSLLIKQPHTNTRQPGHCPINQLVNVIRRMWDVAALGQMKHVERTFILHSGIRWEVELYSGPGPVI